MNGELQDAVTLAEELKPQTLAEALMQTSVSVALVAVFEAKAEFDRLRATGSKAEYLRASHELTRAIDHLRDQEIQAGVRR